MLIRMESGCIGDTGLDAGARLEALIRKARSQAQEQSQETGAEPTQGPQGSRVLVGPNGAGLAAAAAKRIDFEDPLARECFIGALQQDVQGENKTSSLAGQHELDPERVAALLGMT